MKSYQILKNEAEQKLKKQKEENALGVISKSLKKNTNKNCPKGSGGNFSNPVCRRAGHKSFSMSNIRNYVQLIGNLGEDPTITDLDDGKKVATFSLATNEHYKNAKGEKVQSTEWHSVVAWGKTAEIIEKYVTKGKEIAVTGKLKTRSYEDKHTIKRWTTEIIANEILLLGGKSDT